MLFFCLLWVPLFYYFRRSVISAESDGLVWALPLGIAYTALQFFSGTIVTPGGFGLSRWMSGFADIVCLPVLIPLAVCLLLIALRALPGNADIAGFIMLWLIPLSALRSVKWSSPGIPEMLVLVPILWTALGTGIPILIGCVKRFPRWFIIIPAALGVAVLPFTAATSWWAFYCQKTLIGYLFLAATLIPVTAWTILNFTRTKQEQPELQTAVSIKAEELPEAEELSEAEELTEPEEEPPEPQKLPKPAKSPDYAGF
jgi:hypothetical protein